MNPFDLTVFRWLNGLAGQSRMLDLVAAGFTTYAPVLFGALFLLYFLFEPADTARMRRTILLAGLSGVLALTVAVIVASVVYRARPFLTLPSGQVHLLIPHSNDSSFPSDHATGSAAFAAGMWRSPDRSARWVFAGTALLVGISRLIAGVHWPSDILVSLVLGGLVAWGTFALEPLLRPLLDWILQLFGRVERLWKRA